MTIQIDDSLAAGMREALKAVILEASPTHREALLPLLDLLRPKPDPATLSRSKDESDYQALRALIKPTARYT